MSAVAHQQFRSNMPIMKRRMPKLCQEMVPTEQVLDTLRRDIASFNLCTQGSLSIYLTNEVEEVLARMIELAAAK